LCHNPTSPLPSSSCQRLRNIARGLDEKLRDGAERAVLQADNSGARAYSSFTGKTMSFGLLENLNSEVRIVR
jgi:hypothetical protein